MGKKNRTQKILKGTLFVIGIPILLIVLFMAMVYLPPVQNYIIKEIREHVDNTSGYNLEARDIRLTFPLRLSVSDFSISRKDSIYLQGERLDADISLIPLFIGDVEINYISFENLTLDTRDLISTAHINGKVGYARVVSRASDIANSIIDIRQLHIQEADINITRQGKRTEERTKKAQWIVKLRSGSIKESRFGYSTPADTLDTEVLIGKLLLNNGYMDTRHERYSADRISFSGSGLKYNKGKTLPEEYPLDHITLDNIGFDAGELFLDNKCISATISGLTMKQPGGLNITDASARFTSNADTLQLHKLDIISKNGSSVHGHFIIPRQTLLIPINKRFKAELDVIVDKRDLTKLVTPEVYKKLNCFENRMLKAELALSGNVHNISIDTLSMKFPGIGTMNISGNVKNALKKNRINGNLNLKGHIENIGRIIDYDNYCDSVDGKISVNGDIRYNSGDVSMQLAVRAANGNINANGRYNFIDTTYKANIDVEKWSLSGILPQIPLDNLSMSINAKGKGVDIFNNETAYRIEMGIDTLCYAGYRFMALEAVATQAKSVSRLEIEGKDKSLLFRILSTTRLIAKEINNHTTIELKLADLKEIGITDAELKTSANIDITASSDLKEKHKLKLVGDGTRIETEDNSFTPERLLLEFDTNPQATDIKVANGDLDITGKMDCGYNTLFSTVREMATMYEQILKSNRFYGIRDFEKKLPNIALKFKSGENNILHNYLAFNGIMTKQIDLEVATSPAKGVEMEGSIYQFCNAALKLDSFNISAKQEDKRHNYSIVASNLAITRIDEDNSYNTTLQGWITDDSITANIKLRDNIKQLDSRLGVAARVAPQILDIHFNRDALIFGTPFFFNKDNYINIGKAMKMDADVKFFDSDSTGFHLYTIPDNNVTNNVYLKLFNIELPEITGLIPGTPSLGGTIDADISYRSTKGKYAIACDMNADSLTYENKPIGNERINLNYTSHGNRKNYIDLSLYHHDSEIVKINSDIILHEKPEFNGSISLKRLPLGITKTFMDKEGLQLDGYLNCDISFTGNLSDMESNGYILPDSIYAYIPMLGATLHPDNKRIVIEESKANFREFHIFDKANSPFIINGTVGIADLLHPLMELRLNATNYEVLNKPYSKNSKNIYGKLYVDLRSIIRGTPDDLRLFGGVTMLGNSDFAYILPETAFETEKELDGLVEFVNFNDTTAITEEKLPAIDLGDIVANFNITIKEGAKVALDFDNAHENYIIFDGDGSLNATYDENGLNVTGIYKLNDGQLKLTLPIIPLKTFYIQEGGKITWTGDLYNPTVDITALEKTTVSVEFEDSSIQPVTFNTGVVLSNTVNDLGIGFTMSSPENSIIQNQLNGLDEETLSKYAVAMIITGTYLGGRQGVTATSALSSFLDAKINDISGEAIKNLDVNIGINDGLDAQTGSAYKNYSFSFSKRFLNDRITVVIGGEVNSGDHPEKNAGNSSIINNVSLEWRLNESGNRYIRIFYDKDYRSMLEGEITETGIGYVYKRKLNNLKELFTFKKKDKTEKTDDKKENSGESNEK